MTNQETKKAMTHKTYKVMTISENSWNTDGSPIIESECNHNHRTLSGAKRCLDSLTKRHTDGMYSAKWYHAHIRHANGTALTESELDQLDKI